MKIVAAVLYAMSTSILLAMAIAFVGGALNPVAAAVALTSGSFVGVVSLLPTQGQSLRRRALSAVEWTVIVTFALFSLRAFLWLVFIDGDAIKVLSPNNLGDLSLHLTYIRYLANGAPFWPDNPIFASGPLTYPVGIDLFNSLLKLIGVDDLRGLIWVGLVGCACTGVALWRWGGAFTLAGFLCNGGLAGFAVLHEFKFTDFQSGPESDLAWKSLPLALLVTQRGLLFALPAGLLLLCSWRLRFFTEDEQGSRLPRWGEVLLYASLPIFHFHTFLFLSIVLAVWFAVVPAARRSLLTLVSAAFLPATTLVLLITDCFRGPTMLGWKPGWMQGDEGFISFWLRNFGALPFFVAALAWTLWRNKARRWPGSLVFTGIGVFLLCCFVKFAPWEWDNTKLMLWSYLVVLPFLWSHVITPWPWILRVLSCTLLFFSGLLSLIGGLDSSHKGYEIASRSRLDGAAVAVRDLPISATFVGWPTYNHPLLLLGRKMTLGYIGHTQSHGLDWQPTNVKVEEILHGEPGWRERCVELRVRYLFWGADEMENVSSSAQPWRESARLVAHGSWGELYDLDQPAVPVTVPQVAPPPTVAPGPPESPAVN